VILVALIRMSVSMGASLAGVLATAVLWKPGVIVGALLVPVITVFADQALGEPLLRLTRRAPDSHHSGRHNVLIAVLVGLIGFLIVGATLTVPKLLEGDPLRATPLFGGHVPLVETPRDADGDGVADAGDNCPGVANPDQANTNGAGRGDACDPDDDNDRVLDEDDNCPAVANPGQENANGAGRGDACDPDDDNDTVVDEEDNCPAVANSGQEDADGDAIGDACDEPAAPTDEITLDPSTG
jgi:Thrombospondin type 3 repeat